MFKQTKKMLLDMLFPVQCLLCKKDNVWICKKCLDKIEILPSQVCPYCEKIEMPAGKICSRCKENLLGKNKIAPVDNLAAAASYKDVSHFIHLLKYRFVSDLYIPLGKILVKAIIKNNFPLPDLIIPVPLHKRRLRWRGFNQSELLANYIGENLTPGFQIPVRSDMMVRKKYTVPQMKIKNYSERKKNLQNVFVLDEEKAKFVKDKKILLVDDVATTGSTLFECGQVLKANGAHKICACVIARQELKNVL